MKAFVVATIIVALLLVAVYFVFDSFLLDEDYADSTYEHGVPLALASLTLLGLPILNQLLSGRRRRYSLTELPAQIERFDRYLLPGGLLYVYGVAFLYLASAVAILAIWLAGLVTGFFITRLVALLDLVLLTVANFLVGSWVGKRSRRSPVAITLAVVVTFAILAALTLSFVRDSFRILPFALTTVAYVLAALAGTCRGVRARVSAYTRYLLTYVPRGRQPAAAEALYQITLDLTGDKQP
jgi:hypothetical protein